MKNLCYEKVYEGPFSLKEALDLTNDLAAKARPEVNSIYGARIARRAKGGYDVEILTDKYERSF